MAVVRSVGFKLKSLESFPEVDSKMRSLQRTCKKDGQPCIIQIVGGLSVGDERYNKGLNVAYTLFFCDEEAREYYVNEDTSHQQFGAWLMTGGQLEDLLVIDFVDGRLPGC